MVIYITTITIITHKSLRLTSSNVYTDLNAILIQDREGNGCGWIDAVTASKIAPIIDGKSELGPYGLNFRFYVKLDYEGTNHTRQGYQVNIIFQSNMEDSMIMKTLQFFENDIGVTCVKQL